ncbi:tyrosine recombinase [Solibaculum mannosilyticum]|uniref:tyrosine recombinase n=1 Tax=Solibaculum mannosilyticum TaxID=2780922 RepID=UPI0034C42649
MDYLASFEQYLVDYKSLASNTLSSYRKDVECYLRFLDEQGILSPVEAGEDVIRRFIDKLQEAGRSPSTVTRSLASLRSFYQYLMLFGYMDQNPAKEIKVERAQKKLPQILNSQEIERLLNAPNPLEFKGCRDKAMLELLYATGIRVSELVHLDVGDVNLEVGILHCRGSRSGRVIPIYPTAVEAVSDYISRVRAVIAASDSENALFLNLNGQRLTRQGFWKIIKSCAQSAHIDKDITPHTLRHSFAAHLLENGAQLKDIQEMMGHVDISSTQVYAQVVQERFKDVYQNCHPRAKQRA